MRQMPKNAKNCETGKHRGECVQRSDYGCVSVNIVAEFVERWVRNKVTKSNGQWKETLSDSRIPNLNILISFELKLILRETHSITFE